MEYNRWTIIDGTLDGIFMRYPMKQAVEAVANHHLKLFGSYVKTAKTTYPSTGKRLG